MTIWRDETLVNLGRRGFTTADAVALIRCSAALHKWAERECNGEIQRDEENGDAPYLYNTNTGEKITGPIPDRETGALKRAKAIAERYGFLIYHQGDPRGCCLYIYRQADLNAYASRVSRPEKRNEAAISSCYSSVGFAVVP